MQISANRRRIENIASRYPCAEVGRIAGTATQWAADRLDAMPRFLPTEAGTL